MHSWMDILNQARKQLEGVIAAQQELISDQRKAVRDKESKLREVETKLRLAERDLKVHSWNDCSLIIDDFM